MPDIHTIDHALIRKILLHVTRKNVEFELERCSAWPEELAFPYVTYQLRSAGRTAASLFVAERGWSLSDRERRWIEAQQEATLSIYEVAEVRPPIIRLRDVFTDAIISVHEVSGSRTVHEGGGVLTRVTQFENGQYLTGIFPHVLPPRHWTALMREAVARFGIKPKTAAATLRENFVSEELVAMWSDAVEVASRPPEVRNSTGDALLLTTDTFAFAPVDREQVVGALAKMPRCERDEDGAGFIVLMRGSNSIEAFLRLSEDTLRIETTSKRRADSMRKRVERAAGALIAHRSRALVDPMSAVIERSNEPPAEVSQEALEAMRAFKAEHYRRWCDEPVPVFGGCTPREMVKTVEGRAAVWAEIEFFSLNEQNLPPEERYDFRQLRQELGILPVVDLTRPLLVENVQTSSKAPDLLIDFSIAANDDQWVTLLLHRTPEYEALDPERRGVDVRLLELDRHDEFDALVEADYVASEKRLHLRTANRSLELDLSEAHNVKRMLTVLKKMNVDSVFVLQGV